MIPAPFDYRRPASLEEALELMAATEGRGAFLAGGHSLIPLMKLRLSEPETLIDVGRLPELRGIRELPGLIEIGAGATHHEVAASELVRERAPMVADAAGEIGDAQVRNRGTVGGSLAHADPAADWPAVVIALDAEVVVRGPGGERTVRAPDFLQDLFTVDLAEDEILTAVRFEPIQTAAYAKLRQRASHYAIVGVCAALGIDNGIVRWARLGLTGASTHAMRMPAVEEMLEGNQPTEEAIEAAAAVAGDDLEDVNADLHGSEAYRRAMVKVFTRRALDEAVARQ